eukprot:6728059-Prymnesium_polylepis.1
MVAIMRCWLGVHCISIERITGSSEVMNEQSDTALAHSSNFTLLQNVCPLSAVGCERQVSRFKRLANMPRQGFEPHCGYCVTRGSLGPSQQSICRTCNRQAPHQRSSEFVCVLSRVSRHRRAMEAVGREAGTYENLNWVGTRPIHLDMPAPLKQVTTICEQDVEVRPLHYR